MNIYVVKIERGNYTITFIYALIYGIIFLKRCLRELLIPPRENWILRDCLILPYFPTRRSVPMLAAYIGSAIDVPLTHSTFSGIQMLAGSLR